MGGCSPQINSDAHAKLDHSKINALHHDNNLHITAIWNLLIKGKNSGRKTRYLHYLLCSQGHRFMFIHLPVQRVLRSSGKIKICILSGLIWQWRSFRNIQQYGVVVIAVTVGFPGGSAGKESACSAGDLGSIPGLKRSTGEGKGYPLQYSGQYSPEFHGPYSPWGRKDTTEWLSLWQIWIKYLGWK